MKTDLPYLERDEDRHGTPRIYVRRHGKRIRIKVREGTAEFAKAYTEAVNRLGDGLPLSSAAAPTTHPVGSLGWLGAQYFAPKTSFSRLAAASRRARRNCLEECFREPLSDNDAEPMGNCPLKYLTAQKIRRLVDMKADQPGAAANRRKHRSALCAWGVEYNYLPSNPARDVKPVQKAKGGGFYTWTIEDVQQFLAHHPIGTRGALASGYCYSQGPGGRTW